MRKFTRKALTSCGVLALLAGILVSPVVAYADPSEIYEGNGATGRVAQFIELGHQKSLADAKLENLKPEEARFLGVFASNFYTPFLSTLGEPVQVDDEKGKDKKKRTPNLSEGMSKALQETVNFSPEVSKQFTSYILGNVLKGGVELKVGAMPTLTSVDNIHAIDKPSDWLTLLSMISGEPTLTKKYLDNKNRYGVLYYTSNGKNVPAFIWDFAGKEITPSVAGLLTAFGISQPKDGKGISLFDLTPQQVDLGNFDRGSTSSKSKLSLLAQDPYKYSFYNSKMKLSPFGDLVIKGQNHTWVAIPAALNATTWKSFKGKAGTSGDIFPLANYQTMVSTAMGTGLWSSPNHFNSQRATNTYTAKDAYGAGMVSSEGYSLPLNLGSSRTGSGDANKWFFQSSEMSGVFDKLKTQLKSKKYPASFRVDSSYGMWYADLLGYIHRDVGIAPHGQPVDIVRAVGRDLTNNSVGTANKLVILDSLDAFQGEVPEDGLYQPVMEGNGSLMKGLSNVPKAEDLTWDDAVNLESLSKASVSMPKSISASLYVTTLLATMGNDEVKTKLGYTLNTDMPPLTNASFEFGDEEGKDPRVDRILDYMYTLLNPSWDHVEYFAQLVTSKVAGLLTRWHNDMIGAQNVNVVQGTTKYVGFAGYVSTPNLHDLPWTDALVSLYNTYSGYLVVFVLVVLICYSVLGAISWKKALASFIVFILLSLMIIPTTNVVINTSNSLADSIYGNKFTYWAMLTHQSYSQQIDESASGDNYGNYLRTLYANNTAGGVGLGGGDSSINAVNNKGTDNILVKWQKPKSRTAISYNKDIDDSLEGNDSLRKMLKGAVNASLSGESYIEDPYSQYLYRSYVDIANQSKYVYLGLSNRYGQAKQAYSKPDLSSWKDKGLVTNWGLKDTLVGDDAKMGYTNVSRSGNSGGEDYLAINAPLSSKIVSSHFNDSAKMDKLTLGTYVGIPSGAFEFPLKPYTKGDSFIGEINSKKPGDFSASTAGYSEEEYASLGAYALMTESPFYYFSWYLYDQGLNPDGGEGSLKDLILSAPNQGFFYNSVGSMSKDGKFGTSTQKQNGELKDYLGMRGLFTYVIPYLKQGNDVVKEYQKRFGLTIYPSLPFVAGHENDLDIKDDPNLRQKYWQNVNVAQLGNMYTPWVDLMYDSSYAQPETISVQGNDVIISDPLNPSSYPKERPMVFSPAEMVDYGLTRSDLTKVETRIVDFLEGTKKDIFTMLNYYNFKDSVVDTGASMLSVFKFNETFSDINLLGQGTQLYPQSYELKNFSYDAYLRLIMANSLGKDLLKDKGNFYLTTIQESSLMTAIMVIVTDFTNLYALPLLKYAAILGLVVVVILLSCATIFKSYEGDVFKRLKRSVLVPLVKILALLLTLTWVLSLFMGEPANSVTGEIGFSLKFGEPVMTLLALCGLSLLFCFLYFKLVQGIWKDVKTYGGMVFSSAVGAIGGVAMKLRGKMGTGAKTALSTSASIAGSMSSNLKGTQKVKIVNDVIKVTGKPKAQPKKGNSKVKPKTSSKASSSKLKLINSKLLKGKDNIKGIRKG